jgi:hypothetical protein
VVNLKVTRVFWSKIGHFGTFSLFTLRENNKTLKIRVFVEQQAISTMFFKTCPHKFGDFRKRRPIRFTLNGHFRIERKILHKIYYFLTYLFGLNGSTEAIWKKMIFSLKVIAPQIVSTKTRALKFCRKICFEMYPQKPKC